MEDKAVLELIRKTMPRISGMVGEKRREWGDAHVVQCQRRGLAGEPGWFFAREGVVAIGTPWAGDPVIADYMGGLMPKGGAFLCLRPPEVSHGAH